MKRQNFRSFICHGREKRCFKIRGITLPICARCTGFYSGVVLGVGSGKIFDQFIGLTAIHLFLLTIVVMIPFTLDGTLQGLTSWESDNWLRFGTGILLGFFIGLDIWWMLFIGI
ncbi:MAG: DUF2085 domain-containing protein [Candidatus Saliniplasma sp.]